jgi:hypothetical protein
LIRKYGETIASMPDSLTYPIINPLDCGIAFLL